MMEHVIPCIRQNGVYMSDEVINKTLQDPDFIIQMATKLKEEKEQRMLAQRKAGTLEATITLNEPYTKFAKSIAASSDAITIGQFAKLLNNNNIVIGRNRLFKFFRDHGYLIKTGEEKNIPEQVYVEQGLFKVSESIVNTAEGKILSVKTLITVKGQMHFWDIL